MAKRRIGRESSDRQRRTSNLPVRLRPDQILHFVESPQFTRRWGLLGLSEETDLWDLQTLIMESPRKGSMIRGTGGLRKLRFAPERDDRGQRGAYRVLYAYFEQYHVVFLSLIYGKEETGNISDAVKMHLSKTISEIERELSRRKSID